MLALTGRARLFGRRRICFELQAVGTTVYFSLHNLMMILEASSCAILTDLIMSRKCSS